MPHREFSVLSIAQPITSQVFRELLLVMLKLFCVTDRRRRQLIIDHVHSFYFFNLLTQAIGKHCHSLQSIVLSQCGSLSSKGISTLVSKCRQLKMLDVAMTKVILIHKSRKIVAQAATSSHA